MANTKKLVLILLMAFVLRIISVNQSLWLDEAIGAIAIRNFSYTEIITKFISYDNHTPGYYLLLKLWASIFGTSEIALRSLSIMFGLLTIYATYEITKHITKRNNIALASAILLATSQIHVYYSQEARMYCLVAFFASLSILYFIKALNENKNIYWAVFSVSMLGMVLSDYMPVFFLPIFPVYVFFRKRKLPLKLIFSFIPLLVFSVLWFPMFQSQFANYSQVPNTFLFGGATFKQAALLWMKFVFGRISLAPKIVYYSLIAFASVPAIIALFAALKNKKNLILWLWLLVPPASAFLISFLFPAFSYFRFIYTLPAFYILIASTNKKLLTTLIIVFNLVSLYIYYIDKNQQREQWRQAVSYIESKADDSSIAIFEFPDPFAPYLWYSQGRVEAKGATDSISANLTETKLKTREVVANKRKVYYFEYLRDVSDPGRVVENTIAEEGFRETDKTNQFVGVGAITVYEKNR